MVKSIIEAYPKEKREAPKDGTPILYISECFSDTIQGENLVGMPATFLRLQGCTLNCSWCDSAEVWRCGNPYTIKELVKLWYTSGVIEKMRNGQHLVLTGGSPLKQQASLGALIDMIHEEFKFYPIVEVENECTIMPNAFMMSFVDIWNNSPKLANSNMPRTTRYNPDILQALSQLRNSYFKFVIASVQDWEEIKKDFLDTKLIKKHQIVLMPEGMTREELQKHYQIVIDIAAREGIRMTDRLHVTIWNKKTGV